MGSDDVSGKRVTELKDTQLALWRISWCWGGRQEFHTFGDQKCLVFWVSKKTHRREGWTGFHFTVPVGPLRTMEASVRFTTVYSAHRQFT